MERIAKTAWRENTPRTSSLPMLGPGPDGHILKVCKTSPAIQDAARALGEKGLDYQEAATLLNIPPQLAEDAIAAAVERGRLQMLAKMASTVTRKALSGEDKALMYWMKARGGDNWQDSRPPQSQQQMQQQTTTIVINTGVPLPEGPSAQKEITLTKRDFQHIPELRSDE